MPDAFSLLKSTISIHALRVEGDRPARYGRSGPLYFYPRPPGGGRQQQNKPICKTFHHFYPRPPGGGRQSFNALEANGFNISIHALRVEGDNLLTPSKRTVLIFLSTPSGWRATYRFGRWFRTT